MSPRLTAAITVAIHELKRRPYSTIRNDTVAELEAALAAEEAQPSRSQRMSDAGFAPRDRRLECDECGEKFSNLMLPIHKCGADS